MPTDNSQNVILTELAKISTKLEGLEEKYDLLNSQIVAANQNVQSKIDAINQLLQAPDSGLIVKITKHGIELERHNEKFRAIEDWKKWATRVFFGSFLTAVAGAVVFAVKKLLVP
jgi:hypothetical protein